MTASPPGPAPEELPDLAERLADGLASWWEAETGEATYAHQWTAAAERALQLGPDRSV